MATTTERTFEALLREVSKLEVYGANAVYRRIRSLIGEFARSEADGKSKEIDLDPTRRPCNGFPNGRRWKPLSFDHVVREVEEDDGRRTIFLDPSEAVVAGLAQFLSGRLQTLEFREPTGALPLAALEEKATEFLRGKLPSISINFRMASSPRELVHGLRYLADKLEQQSVQDVSALAYTYAGNAATRAGECTFERKEQIGNRYTNNGKKLEYRFRDVYKCVTHDPCCGNPSYHYEYQNDRWEVVWEDTGNSTSPPPVNPPDFQNSPWNNQLPVFTDPSIGTLTSDYGWRSVNGQLDFHPGIDISATAGSNVQSNISGTVVHINSSGTGNHPEGRGVIVRDANNQTHTYWHINPSNTLQVGDSVNVGDRLGGLYDWGTRSHLHHARHAPPGGDWQQRSDANSQNPLP